jgi:hypothetical protein
MCTNCPPEGVSTDDMLAASLSQLGLGSRCAARRALQNHRETNGDVFKCLTCGQYFDAFKDLRCHLKQRKHLKGSDQVKRLRTDFIAERLQGDGITSTEEAQRMFDEDEPRAMTEGERKTWTEYNIQLAWLQNLA